MKFTELQDVPSSYVGQDAKLVRVNDAETELEFGGAYLDAGLDLDKGTAGRKGRVWWATDTLKLYYDDGDSWVETLRGEGAIRLAEIYERLHDSLLGVSADQHHNQLHCASHGPAQADALKLDDLEAPDDTTDLNASTAKHGLLRKADGVTTHFLRGDLGWEIPSAGAAFTLSHGAECSHNETAWFQVAEVVVRRTGTYTVRFQLKTSNVSYAANGRIYKDGVAFGTAFSTHGTSYEQQSEDLDFSAGEALQLWSAIDNAAAVVWTRGLEIIDPTGFLPTFGYEMY